MRGIPKFLVIAAVVGAVVPAAARAQTFTACSATDSSGTQLCHATKAASATVAQVLKISIKTAVMDLQAGDSVAYEKTYAAWNNNQTAAVSGTIPPTPAALQDASVTDSVIAIGNRPFFATLQASDDSLEFDKDAAGYNTCRGSAAGGTCANVAHTVGGKSVHDIIFQPNKVTYDGAASGAGTAVAGTWQVLPALSEAAYKWADLTSTGGRVGMQVKVKSAWYYATDIPGTYRATLVYTITGQ